MYELWVSSVSNGIFLIYSFVHTMLAQWAKMRIKKGSDLIQSSKTKISFWKLFDWSSPNFPWKKMAFFFYFYYFMYDYVVVLLCLYTRPHFGIGCGSEKNASNIFSILQSQSIIFFFGSGTKYSQPPGDSPFTKNGNVTLGGI